MARFPRVLAPLMIVLPAAPTLAQTCEPRWSDDLWAHTPPGDVRALVVLDDGAGPALHIGTSDASEGGWVARYDGLAMELLAHATGTLPTSATTGVYALAIFDDGSGPALHVGGTFTDIDGVAASGIARRTGSGWAPLGLGADRGVRALATYDDGSGPALYAAGYFDHAGGLAASRIARWDGLAWSEVAGGLAGGGSSGISSVYPLGLALLVHDLGAGPVLCVGGNFDAAGPVAARNVATWNGTQWGALGAGPGAGGTGHGGVVALTVFDAGAGPELIAGGDIFTGAPPHSRAARWTGSTWEPVGSAIGPGLIAGFCTADLGSGPALHAGLSVSSSSTQNMVVRLDNGAWTPIAPTTYPRPVRAMAAFDDGAGLRVYAGGEFSRIATSSSEHLARWDGLVWDWIPAPSSRDPIERLRVVDLGAGPELYAAGSTRLGGVFVPLLGRFDGTAWHPVGPLTDYRDIADVESYDDGAGPMLYAARNLTVGGVHYRVARLREGEWEGVGASTTAVFGSGGVGHLRAFDDGTGPRLFAAGAFVGGIAAWDGLAWVLPGGGLPVYIGSGVDDLEVFDAGAGPLLYAAWESGIARWNGDYWQAVGGPSPDSIRDLHAFDDGTGPALYAARTGSGPDVLRFDGNVWEVLPGQFDSSVLAIHAFDDGDGPALYAAGQFTMIDGVPAPHIARWRAGAWSPVGAGLDASARTLAVFPLPQPALWAGGEFYSAGGRSAGHLARWIGCPGCYADCDGSGALDVNDYICFQTKFALGDPYADCDGNGVRNVNDYICFQTRFAIGCR